MAQTHILRLVQVRAALNSGEARRIREAARLTISEVARAVGVDQSTVWRWENGARVPRSGQQITAYSELIDSLRHQSTGQNTASKDSDGAEEQLPGLLDAAERVTSSYQR
jgi:transcriptional regulator with XRE-family HTH domain